MLHCRLYTLLSPLLLLVSIPLSVWADDAVMPPPVHDTSKIQTEKNTSRPASVNDEAISLKKELVPDNIGKDVQVRSYIRSSDQAKISEYTVHGRVYMVKVQPAGDMPAYYLYDEEGDGNFSRRLPANYQRLNPPVWVLKKF